MYKYSILIQIVSKFQDQDLINNIKQLWAFSCGSDSKESVCNAGEPDLIPWLGRSPGKGNDYPFQYPSPENFTNRVGRLLSMVSQRVRHDWTTNTHVQQLKSWVYMGWTPIYSLRYPCLS